MLCPSSSEWRRRREAWLILILNSLIRNVWPRSDWDRGHQRHQLERWGSSGALAGDWTSVWVSSSDVHHVRTPPPVSRVSPAQFERWDGNVKLAPTDHQSGPACLDRPHRAPLERWEVGQRRHAPLGARPSPASQSHTFYCAVRINYRARQEQPLSPSSHTFPSYLVSVRLLLALPDLSC